MKNSWYKKGLVVGIIILFIAVSFAPSINANIDRIPIKNKFVETSIRIHRARSITPYTLKLTEKESDEVDRIFDNLKVSLDSAETLEETDEIFNDAVESLYELGLFPNYMTLRESQQLVTGESLNPIIESSLVTHGTGEENFNCRIAGKVTECFMFDLGKLFIGGILFNLILLLGRGIFPHLWTGFNFPLFVGRIGQISFGTIVWMMNWWFPSNGWIWTNGSNGEIKWEGWFFGNIDEITINKDIDKEAYVGVNEFKGIWIDRIDYFEPPCFLGNAEQVKISYDTPYR